MFVTILPSCSTPLTVIYFFYKFTHVIINCFRVIYCYAPLRFFLTIYRKQNYVYAWPQLLSPNNQACCGSLLQLVSPQLVTRKIIHKRWNSFLAVLVVSSLLLLLFLFRLDIIRQFYQVSVLLVSSVMYIQ